MVDINVRPLSKALWVLASAGKWRIRDIHKFRIILHYARRKTVAIIVLPVQNF